MARHTNAGTTGPLVLCTDTDALAVSVYNGSAWVCADCGSPDHQAVV